MALIATVWLSACKVGPNYSGPPKGMTDRNSVSGHLAGHGESIVSQASVPEHWWHLYNDARLDGLVEQALVSNVDLQVAEANIRQALAVVLQIDSSRTPATALQGGLEYAKTGIPAPSPAGFAYSVAGSLSYPLDLFGGIRRAVEAAQYDAQAVMAARDVVRLTIVVGVTRSYIAVCSANRTYAATASVVDIQRETQVATQRLFEGGRATAFDVSRASAATEQSRAALPGIIAARQIALFQLGALIGGAPADYPAEVADCPAPPSLNQPLPVGDGAALIRRRPDLRQAERRLAAATAQIGVDVAQLYPAIVLGASAGSAGPFSLYHSSSNINFGIGPLISWTIPNQMAVRAEIRAAGAAADAAAAGFDAAVIEALRQSESVLSTYARAADTAEALEKARDAARLAYRQADRLFLFGRTDFLNLLTAEASLAGAETSLAQSLSSVADDQISLFLALGGGWER